MKNIEILEKGLLKTTHDKDHPERQYREWTETKFGGWH